MVNRMLSRMGDNKSIAEGDNGNGDNGNGNNGLSKSQRPVVRNLRESSNGAGGSDEAGGSKGVERGLEKVVLARRTECAI
eukprot:144645-Prorocentrum_minimum.AAC.1